MRSIAPLAIILAAALPDRGQHISTIDGGSSASPDRRFKIIASAAKDSSHASQITIQLNPKEHPLPLLTSWAGGRGIDVVWSPSSRKLAINNYEGNSGDRLYVYRISSKFVECLRRPNEAALSRLLLQRHSSFTELERVSFHAVRWVNEQTLDTLVRGRTYTRKSQSTWERFAFEWVIHPSSKLEIVKETPTSY